MSTIPTNPRNRFFKGFACCPVDDKGSDSEFVFCFKYWKNYVLQYLFVIKLTCNILSLGLYIGLKTICLQSSVGFFQFIFLSVLFLVV